MVFGKIVFGSIPFVTDNDLYRHIDYIHYNPVKHHHCQYVKDWQYSSFHRFVKNKKLPITWGQDYQETISKVGEP